MIKKIICLSLILLSIVSTIAFADDIKIYVNDREIQTDSPALIVNDTTMIPFRTILNELGIPDEQIIWDEASQSLEVITEATYIFMAIGLKAAIVNGNMKDLLVAPFISDEGRTMMPVRFISESLGAEVKWNNDTKSIYISKEVV